MNSYKLRYYNSGGYKSSLVIETPHLINQDENQKLQVVTQSGEVIGDVELIEQLLNEEQGWVEDNCVFAVEAVTSS